MQLTLVDRETSRRAASRQCGPCQECCTVFRIDELNKPTGTRCQHQCDAGCGIHKTKPTECSEYQCLWLQGAIEGGEEYRPDRCGMVLDHGMDQGTLSLWVYLQRPIKPKLIASVASRLRKKYRQVAGVIVVPYYLFTGLQGSSNRLDYFINGDLRMAISSPPTEDESRYFSDLIEAFRYA